MASVPDTATAPVPFFTDQRSLVEKLNCDKRPWLPHKSTDDPPMIFGLVVERGTFLTAYRDEVVPTARVLTADNIEWSVIAFAGYLKSEFERKNPRVGDFAAFAYRGVKPARKEGENDAYDFVIEVERNPGAPYTAATVDESSYATEPADAADEQPSTAEPVNEDGGVAAPFDDGIPFMPTSGWGV